ncbi:MAG: UvrD-helicase domain-containing protein, partial [Burkholderiales bacterium]
MTFSEDAIRSVGARLKRDLDDEKIRAILQAEESRDIQAAPGSGKTSVMGAKLTLLARSWPYANRGICILSHTNVAKDEIAELLAKTSEGRQLLKPPHFLGTIQSFVNQVFALPYIRACGLPFEALDESRHARLAKQYFSAEKYRGTRYYLAQKHTGGDVEDFAGSLEFVNSPREIRHAIPLPGKDTDTYKNLLDVKQRVAAQGIYRYNDMYAFAHAYIDEFPWIIEAVRYRFPNVFIDEMQDTSKLQFDFLARVFDRDTLIVQRFGDSDQAIYDLQGPEDEQGSDFPVAPVLTLDDSRRFGPFIAEQVTALSLSSQQVLGKGPSEAKRNTIFL